MAIRFVNKPAGAAPPTTPASKGDAQAQGEARFATPIEATQAVNPDPAGELPFTDLPAAAKASRTGRARTPTKGRP